jgi:hypothetical protein
VTERTHDDPVLQALGRVEGKLDAFTNHLGGHDADIDELRREQATTNAAIATTNVQVASLATTLKVVAWLIGVVVIPGLSALGAVIAITHGGH